MKPASIRRRWLTAGALAAANLIPNVACGQQAEAAEALFQQGRLLLEQGKVADACEKLEASQALDSGVGTLLFLGECRERQGKVVRAYRAFEAATALAHAEEDERREALAALRMTALRPRLPTLTVRVPEATRNLEGLDVRLDGVALPGAAFNAQHYVDPGQLLIVVTAPGQRRWETRLSIPDGPSHNVVDIPPLERSVVTPAETRVRKASSSPTEATSRKPPGSSLRTWGLVSAGVGLVGIGAGTFWGLRSLRQLEDSRKTENCPLEDRCYASGLTLRADARDSAHLADLAWVAGGVFTLTGIVLYAVAPALATDEHAWAVELKPQGANLSFGGEF